MNVCLVIEDLPTSIKMLYLDLLPNELYEKLWLFASHHTYSPIAIKHITRFTKAKPTRVTDLDTNTREEAPEDTIDTIVLTRFCAHGVRLVLYRTFRYWICVEREQGLGLYGCMFRGKRKMYYSRYLRRLLRALPKAKERLLDLR